MTKKKGNETVAELVPALQYIDYLIPNVEEAMLITGKETVEQAAECLWETRWVPALEKGKVCGLDRSRGQLYSGIYLRAFRRKVFC